MLEEGRGGEGREVGGTHALGEGDAAEVEVPDDSREVSVWIDGWMDGWEVSLFLVGGKGKRERSLPSSIGRVGVVVEDDGAVRVLCYGCHEFKKNSTLGD